MSRLEEILFGLYLLVGPVFCFLYSYAVALGVSKMRLLTKPRPMPNPPPLCSILIPAKDEEQRIEACLTAALAQDYTTFEVIAVDDRSSDRTGAIMDELAARDSRLKAVHIRPDEMPEGWSGKNHALHQASLRAGGKWLLFVDCDVTVQPTAVSRCVALCQNKNYDLFSVLAALETKSAWEKILIPLCSMASSAMYMGLFINSDKRGKTPFANGQFMMASRHAYDTIGGHEAMKAIIGEDTEMARLMLANNFRVRVSLGDDVCSIRMYDGFSKIIRGWARIYFAARAGQMRQIIAAIAIILICCFSAYPVLAYGIHRIMTPHGNWLDRFWLVAAGVHLITLTALIGFQYRLSKCSWLLAVLFPVSGLLLLWTLMKAGILCMTRKVEWRGTSYAYGAAGGVVSK